MTRVKRGTISLKRRRNILSRTKGFRYGRKNKEATARTAIHKAGQNAFRHRRMKKRDFRGLWNTRINAEVRKSDLSYSKFIGLIHKKNIILDRKVLAEIAQKNPEIFAKIVASVKA